MAKPTTIRLPEELLRDLDERAKAHGKDRASFLRDILRDALARDVEDEVLETYARGAISFTDACQRLRIDPWELLDLLRRRNLRVSVSLEDWLDSRSSL